MTLVFYVNGKVYIAKLRSLISFHVYPIPRGLKCNLFHAGRGIYARPRDFALAEPMMHQKLCHFVHIKFEQFVGHRKRKQHFKSETLVVTAKKKSRGVKCADIFRPFQNASSKVGKFFFIKTKLTTSKCQAKN